MKEERKRVFIENLKAAGGIICVACQSSGISRCTYYRWRDTDAEFAEAVEEVMEAQIDYVESKLMNLINSGDTTATIFYLKSKGKNRGWTDKQPPVLAPALYAAPVSATQAALPGVVSESRRDVSRRVKGKKDYIMRLLKEQGKYTAELSMQVTLAAQLLVRTEMLAEDVLREGHEVLNVEYSREGNERRTVSPKEKLYLDFVQQSQKALRALGMNTDSKERKTDNDTFGEFLKEFSAEES